MYRHIIFDFGGVFLDLAGRHSREPYLLAKILGLPEAKMVEMWNQSKNDLVRGKITPKEYMIGLISRFGLDADAESAYREWERLYKVERHQIDWGLVEYVKGLRKRYKIHMLTDTIGLDAGMKDWKWEIDQHFDNIFRSHEEKLKKPDKEAFLNALAKAGAKPEECIFIDDFEPNVISAREIGLTAILFRGLEQLKREMQRLGVE